MIDELAGWLDLLACPACQGELLHAGGNLLACAECGQAFPVKDEIPTLVRTDRRAALRAFSREYRRVRLDEGWRPMTRGELIALPEGAPPGYPPLYWQVRRETFAALSRFLRRHGPSPHVGAVADVGAGTGWLAHRLALGGYRAVALDASLDPDFGLGASVMYENVSQAHYQAVQGDLDALPLKTRSYGLVVFNASLHYARDLVATLRRAAHALRPEGRVVVLDTPISRRARPGSGIGDRHLGRRELEGAFRASGLTSRWVRVGRGWRWYLYQLRSALRGNECFNFPMVIGSVAEAPLRTSPGAPL